MRELLLSLFKILINKILPQAEASVKPLFVSFKTDRVQNEWYELKEKNLDLYNIIEDLGKWVNNQYKKQLVLTMIDRTQEEQDQIYKDDKKYQTKKFKSPHQFWHASDIRSSTFTRLEIIQIENYLNDKYNQNNYYKFTAKYHEVGNMGLHFHIQYFKK